MFICIYNKFKIMIICCTIKYHNLYPVMKRPSIVNGSQFFNLESRMAFKSLIILAYSSSDNVAIKRTVEGLFTRKSKSSILNTLIGTIEYQQTRYIIMECVPKFEKLFSLNV